MKDVPRFDPDTREPGYLYQRFADYLAFLIATQALPSGAQLPGERDLAAEHGVSVGTVRRATAVLRDRGFLVTLPAKGTYIAPTHPSPGQDYAAEGDVTVYHEHDGVVLRHDLPETGLAKGQTGVIVGVYASDGYEVEFTTAGGSAVVVTLSGEDLGPR